MKPSDDLIARCKEVRAWHKTGILEGRALRSLAQRIREKHGNVFDMGDAIGHAERDTEREAMDLVIAMGDAHE